VLAGPKIDPENQGEGARRALLAEDYPLAMALAKRAIDRDNQNPDAFYDLGESLRQLGSRYAGAAGVELLGKSAEGFEHGLALFPIDERLLVKCGLVYAQLGDFAKADQLFAEAFHWSPNLGAVYAYYGLRLQLENRSAEAAQAYERSNRFEQNKIATMGLGAR
jgi:tetratricopeptide (TPR) repeat protein